MVRSVLATNCLRWKEHDDMRNTEFTSWLEGFFLICDPDTLSEAQLRCISKHAKLCEYAERGRLTVTNFMIRNSLAEVPLAELKVHVHAQFESVPCPSSEEICYFLQGAFEIDGRERWSRENAELVVDLLDRNVWGLAPPLVQLYHHLTRFLEGGGAHVDVSDLKEALTVLFTHEIDPSYDYDPLVADRLHSGDERAADA